MMTGHAVMMRPADRGHGNTVPLSHLRHGRLHQIKGGIGETVTGINGQHTRARGFRPRGGMAINLARLRLTGIARHPGQAVAFLAVNFSQHQRPCHRPGVALSRAVGHQGFGDDALKFRRVQIGHQPSSSAART